MALESSANRPVAPPVGHRKLNREMRPREYLLFKQLTRRFQGISTTSLDGRIRVSDHNF